MLENTPVVAVPVAVVVVVMRMLNDPEEQSNLPIQILKRHSRKEVVGTGTATFLKTAEIDIVPREGFRKMAFFSGKG